MVLKVNTMVFVHNYDRLSADADFAIARIESGSDEAMEIIGSCPFSTNFISQLDDFEADRELLAHEVYMVICNDEE